MTRFVHVCHSIKVVEVLRIINISCFTLTVVYISSDLIKDLVSEVSSKSVVFLTSKSLFLIETASSGLCDLACRVPIVVI